MPVDDGLGVAVGHLEFAARGLVAAGQAGPDVVGQGSSFGGGGGDFDALTVLAFSCMMDLMVDAREIEGPDNGKENLDVFFKCNW